MNNSSGKVIIVAGLALFAAFAAMVNILSGSGNSVGESFFYVGLIAIAIGFLQPKKGIVVFFLLCAYSDLFKRVMILDTNMNMLDITIVLAMAPLTLAAIFISTYLKGLHQKNLSREDYYSLLFAIGFFLLALAVALKTGRGISSLRLVADYGAFGFLVFIIPRLYSSVDECLDIVKTLLWIFVPVALYGIKQRIYGISDFEMAYLKSGFTIEARQLSDLSVRAFSTLNAATSLTMVCAASMFLSVVLRMARKIGTPLFIFFFLIFVSGSIATLTRTGWIVMIVGIPLFWLYKRKGTVLFVYTAGCAAAIVLVVFSEYFQGQLQVWQEAISGKGDFGRGTQAFRLTTLHDRFEGLINLKKPANWTLFGVDMKKSIYGVGRFDNDAFSHDVFTTFFFRFGAIPCAAILAVLALVTWKSHKMIYSLKGLNRNVATSCLASIAALSVSFAGGAAVIQFPANVFLWMTISLLVMCLRQRQIPRSEGSQA